MKFVKNHFEKNNLQQVQTLGMLSIDSVLSITKTIKTKKVKFK